MNACVRVLQYLPRAMWPSKAQIMGYLPYGAVVLAAGLFAVQAASGVARDGSSKRSAALRPSSRHIRAPAGAGIQVHRRTD
eukprot:364258-Chlamydomonas_euryale.AAC.7